VVANRVVKFVQNNVASSFLLQCPVNYTIGLDFTSADQEVIKKRQRSDNSWL
jgi:hypothetical protein